MNHFHGGSLKKSFGSVFDLHHLGGDLDTSQERAHEGAFFLASLDATTSCITSMAVSASRAGAIGQKKASYFDRRLLASGTIRSPLAGGRGAAGRVPGVVKVI